MCFLHLYMGNICDVLPADTLRIAYLTHYLHNTCCPLVFFEEKNKCLSFCLCGKPASTTDFIMHLIKFLQFFFSF